MEQHKDPSVNTHNHAKMKWFLTKVPRTCVGERIIYSVMMLGKLDFHMCQNKTCTLFLSIYKSQQKSMKILEEKRKTTNLEWAKIFLSNTSKIHG